MMRMRRRIISGNTIGLDDNSNNNRSTFKTENLIGNENDEVLHNYEDQEPSSSKVKGKHESIWRRMNIFAAYVHTYKLFLKVQRPNDPMIDVKILDERFRQMSIFVAIFWVVITTITLYAFPMDCLVELPPSARTAEKIVSFLIFFSLITRISPLVLGSRKGWQRFSGVFFAASVVQIIAGTANGMMGILSCSPVVIDPFTGLKINLLRWCEYVPLAFAMGFLTDAIDATDLQIPIRFALSESISCSFAFLFIIPNIYVWLGAMVMSLIHFFPLYMRLYAKRKRFLSMQLGDTVDEVEKYERVRIAYRLVVTCAFTWSMLVGNYFIGAIGSRYFNLGTDFSIIVEAATDLLAKHFYLSIVVEAHDLVFDDKSRAERRLEELRRMMSVVWASSSDVLLISVAGSSGRIKTQLSPSVAKLCGSSARFPTDAFILDIDASELHSIRNAKEPKNTNIQPYSTIDPTNMLIHLGVKSLIAKVWATDKQEKLIQLILYRSDGNAMHCEAKVTRLNERSLIVVVRDITERQRRFEAEKKVVSQVTARKKDAEANRFTRHEVKNGLLAAIGVCDSLRDIAVKNNSCNDLQHLHAQADIVKPIDEEFNANFSGKIEELDLTLNQTLDIVITEVMARDVINGVYEPRFECTDLKAFFGRNYKNSGINAYKQQHFFYQPELFPLLEVDPMLLLYIHRNAITNAWKFGEKGGLVETYLSFDDQSNTFTMDVINRPGPGHNHIVKLGMRARDIVFAPGKSLHSEKKHTILHPHSRSNGAWIMRSCARVLKGNCDIDFQPDKTVFSFYCPVKLVGTQTMDMEEVKKLFPLPANTWGIGIDDSLVQRKLLNRYLSLVGIKSDHVFIKGSSFEEISRFDTFVTKIILENSNDLFLIVADENLDVNVDGKHWTISGSEALQKIIRKIGPVLEKNVLALVRSANDSSEDIAIYNSRAHGFLPKVPLKREKAQEMLAPLWVDRFGFRDELSISPCSSEYCLTDLVAIDMKADLTGSIERIDYLMDYADDENSWLVVKELLHALKGDLMTQSGNESSREAMDIIDMIRGTDQSDEYVNYQWKRLHSLVQDLLQNIE